MMSGFKWVVEHCLQAQYILFSDDDMYVSTKNVLRFVRNPANYPVNLDILPVTSLVKNKSNNFRERSLKQQLVKSQSLNNLKSVESSELRHFPLDFGEYHQEEELKLYSGKNGAVIT